MSFARLLCPPIRGRHSKRRRIREKAAKRYAESYMGAIERSLYAPRPFMPTLSDNDRDIWQTTTLHAFPSVIDFDIE